jgi:hypothetical protein
MVDFMQQRSYSVVWSARQLIGLVWKWQPGLMTMKMKMPLWVGLETKKMQPVVSAQGSERLDTAMKGARIISKLVLSIG